VTIPVRWCLMAAALALATTAFAQGTAKKELVQKILQIQQSEIEDVARNVVERPAAQMWQEAGLAMQRQVAPEKREAMGKAIEAEIRKYIDEAYPLVRERALRVWPTTIGAALEAKMTEDELKQIVAWLDSPVYRKYQQLGPEGRNAFIQKLLAESQPVVDPKLTALDGRIRVILGIPPAPPAAGPAPGGAAAAGPAAAPARPAAPARAASR
jgi:hypothetical protein